MIIQGNSCVNILHSTYCLPPAEFSARSSDAWMFFCLYIIMKKFVKFALPTILFLYEYMPFLVLDPLHFSYMLLFYCSPSLFATISIAFIYWLCCMTWLLFPDSRFSWLLQTHCISFIIQEERETDERLLRNRRKITYPSYSSAGRVSCFNKRNLLLLNPKDQGDKFYDKYSKS